MLDLSKKIENSISSQKKEEKISHEMYLKLYKDVKTFDKHLARRYDDLRGSTYFLVLLGLIYDKILSREDINRFDEDMRNELLNAIKLWDSDSE